MYTFLIFVGFFFGVSTLIFKGKIKDHRISVGLIIIGGTLIGTTIVNGIYCSKIPQEKQLRKTKSLHTYNYSKIETADGKTIKLPHTYINYFYDEEEHKDSIRIEHNRIDISAGRDYFFPKDYAGKSGRTLKIEFLQDSTKAPYYTVERYMRIPPSKWISGVALPRGKKIFTVYLPNDSIHHVLVNYINEHFKIETKNEKQDQKTARIN